MTRITDGRRSIEITMTVFDGDSNSYSPDFSGDFLGAGWLPYDRIAGAYIVDSVDYCIWQANDWLDGLGDYADVESSPIDNRCVDIREV